MNRTDTKCAKQLGKSGSIKLHNFTPIDLNNRHNFNLPNADKDLSAAKDRQEIELVAQRSTLQEQRNHIGILDTALTNAQHNIRRLEEELRKKQLHIEKLTQMHQLQQQHMQHQQNQQQQLQQNAKGSKQRMDAYEAELAQESNRSGSSTANAEGGKWQLHGSQQMR